MMKYLIVDDHAMTRQAIIESLREPGDTFAEVGTGEEAIDYCAHHAPEAPNPSIICRFSPGWRVRMTRSSSESAA